MSTPFMAIEWKENKIILLDQTALPVAENYIAYDSIAELIVAIQRLVVRGAPALGVTGAYGVVLAMDEAERNGLSADQLEKNIDALRDARPTAVNLAWAVEKIRKHVTSGRDAVMAAAQELASEDKQSSTDMGNIGADWLINKLGAKPLTLLTHCNTGNCTWCHQRNAQARLCERSFR
jgi:methylthioribose-1-phosphate isomerase